MAPPDAADVDCRDGSPEPIAVVLRRALAGLSRAMLAQVAEAAIELLNVADEAGEDLEPEPVEDGEGEASLQLEWRPVVPARVIRRAA